MATNIAINGMGRIGRMVLRIALNNKNLNVKAINASYPPETIAHLLNYDTTHGVYDKVLILSIIRAALVFSVPSLVIER